jgi:hypothetical protein
MVATLKIGHHIVEVHGTDQETLDSFFTEYDNGQEGVPMGCYRCKETEIYILATLKKSMIASVFVHELLECLNDLYDFGLEHGHLSRISECLANALVNNPEFFIEFLEDFGNVKQKENNPTRSVQEEEGKEGDSPRKLRKSEGKK